MLAFRFVFTLLLLAAAACFVAYVATRKPLWRRRGMTIVTWTLVGAFGFFAVLALEALRR